MGRVLRVEHAVPVAAVAVALLVVAAFPPEAAGPSLGSVAAPLGPAGPLAGAVRTVRWVALGLLAAPAVMVYLHRGAAAGGAVACALGWAVLGLGYGWRELLPCGYALVAVLVARHRPVVAADAVPVPEGRRPPPRPDAWPAAGGPAVALAVTVLAAAALAGAGARGAGHDAWLAPAVAAAGVGVALLARVAGRRRALRELFGAPQPVRPARVVDQLGYVHVLVPASDGRTAVEFGINTADTFSTWDPEDGDPRTREALLYGEPLPGAWCAVEVDGRVHVPVEPVGTTTLVPYDADHGVPREVSDDEDQLVDPAALTAADGRAAPDEVREHRVAPVRAWCSTVVTGLGAALAAAEAMHLAGQSGGWPAVAVVASVAGAGFEFGWRSQLRPRLRWHAGGVAAVGFRGLVREPWTVDSAAVHDDEGAVTLTVGDSVLTVAAPAPWPPGSAQRTGDQLVAALRAARTRSFAGGDLPPPPDVVVPRRPLLLYAAWAVTVAGALALFAR
jgi:hypothetical protein